MTIDNQNNETSPTEFLKFHLSHVGRQDIYPEEVEAMASNYSAVRYINSDNPDSYVNILENMRSTTYNNKNFALVPFFIKNPKCKAGHFVLVVVNYKNTPPNHFAIFDTQTGLPLLTQNVILHDNLQQNYNDCGFLVIQGITKLNNCKNFSKAINNLKNKLGKGTNN